MENVLLIVQLLLALALTAVVLLQRSEGGALGMGGGGGGDGMMSSRGAATALSKMTWFLAAGFLAVSLGLTLLHASNSATDSVLERLGTEASDAQTQDAINALPFAPSLPGEDTGGAALPPVAE